MIGVGTHDGRQTKMIFFLKISTINNFYSNDTKLNMHKQQQKPYKPTSGMLIRRIGFHISELVFKVPASLQQNLTDVNLRKQPDEPWDENEEMGITFCRIDFVSSYEMFWCMN